MLPIDAIEIPKINEEAEEHLNERKSEIESTGLLDPPKIMILKREKKQWTESPSAPTMILPEKVDTSKTSPRNWMNMVDLWTSQWIKKVVD